MVNRKVWIVTQKGNIKGVFLSRSSAEEFKNQLENENFEDARNELGLDDDLSETDEESIAFQSGNDSGISEVHFVDLGKHTDGETIYLGQDEFQFEDIEAALNNAVN